MSATPANKTDLGNAERLVARHGQTIRFVHGIGWHIWDRRRWAPDDTAEIERLAKDTIRSIYGEAALQEEDKERKALTAHARASESNGRLKAMIERTRAEASVSLRLADLDADPWALTVQNGIVNLKTGVLGSHDPTAYSTKLAPVRYDSAAQCLRWLAFLDRVFAGDAELIAFVQRAIGYSITGATSEQVLFLLHGTGHNGKTTMLEVLRALLGDYAVHAAFETFLLHRQGPREDIARLDRARLVTSAEAGEGHRLDETLVKSITGGDIVVARFLFRGSFEFRPQFKLWLASNHLPEIRGTDEAIWRRIRLIPFKVGIPPADRDPELTDKLRGELPGILRWAIDGARQWQTGGLGVPDGVRVATEDYRRDSDVLGTFLDDCCEISAGTQVLATLLYETYAQWCERTGERPGTQSWFGRRLQERGFEVVKGGRATQGKKVRIGLRLRQETIGDTSARNSTMPADDRHPANLARDGENCLQSSPAQSDASIRLRGTTWRMSEGGAERRDGVARP